MILVSDHLRFNYDGDKGAASSSGSGLCQECADVSEIKMFQRKEQEG